MRLLTSKYWLHLFILFAVPQVVAANGNLYPIAEVGSHGWVNVRRGPGPQDPVVGTVGSGESFAVQAVGDRYLILDGPFAKGYIPATYVKLSETHYPLVKSTADEVRIRAYPSKNGRVVGAINKNAYFAADQEGEWFAIKDGPFRGNFVHATLAAPIDETGGEATDATPMLITNVAKPSEAEAQSVSGGTPVLDPIPDVKPSEAPLAPVPTTATVPIPTAAPVATAPVAASKPVSTPAPAPPPDPTPTPLAVSTPQPAANAAWDEATEKRFNEQLAKVFQKKKAAESNQVLMPVYINQAKNASGSISTRVLGNREIELESREFFKILSQSIQKSWFDRPEIRALQSKESADAIAWVPVAAFLNTGINVVYDESRLEVQVQVPTELREVGTVSLIDGREAWGNEKVESASVFSSFLNINATEVFDSRNTTHADRRSPVQAQLELGTNVSNFVLEAFGAYTEDRGQLPEGKNTFLRQDVRLTRDFPGWSSRASIGDVIYPVQSFQVYRPMQGIAVYRQFSMGTSKLTYPTGNYEIYLKNKSKVYVWVNDQLQKVLELPVGRHQLRDFQYTSGMNNVRFEIVDEFGQTEIQDHSYTASSELLKPGLHQFSYAAGNPSSPNLTTGERIYDSGTFMFSGFHRYGFSDYFTGGANAQYEQQQSSLGLEGNFSLKKGYLRLESGYSNTELVGSGFALASYYTYVDYLGPQKTQRSYNAGLIYRSDLFAEFGTTTAPAIAKPINLTLGHSRGITKMLSMNLGLNYLLNKGLTTDANDSFALRLGLSNRWRNGISANISASHSQNGTGKDEISILGYLIWSFPKESQTVSAYLNSADSSSRVGWNYNPSSGADAAAYQANYRETSTEKGYGATASINGNRARMAATHEVILTKADEPSTVRVESDHANHLTTLQLGTALVFAGGRFGIGRPVTDSFAIVAPIKSLKGRKLLVNPDAEENYLAKTDWLGPAVVPEIVSYNPTTLVIGAKDLPLGVSVPQDHFNLYPRYKSGYAFPLGTDANVYLRIALVDSSGQPLGMESGVATNLDDPTSPPVTVFTSRRGVIQSEGFKAGRYRLEIALDRYKPVEFVIPEESSEEHDLGTLKLDPK